MIGIIGKFYSNQLILKKISFLLKRECVGIVEEPAESIPWFCPKCHRSNSSTTSSQGIKPSASSKAKRKRASVLYQQKQQQQQFTFN